VWGESQVRRGGRREALPHARLAFLTGRTIQQVKVTVALTCRSCRQASIEPASRPASAAGCQALSGLRLPEASNRQPAWAVRPNPACPQPGAAGMTANSAAAAMPCARHPVRLRDVPSCPRGPGDAFSAPSLRPIHRHGRLFRLPSPPKPSMVPTNRPGKSRQIPKPANGVPAAPECPAARRRVQHGLCGGTALHNLLSLGLKRRK